MSALTQHILNPNTIFDTTLTTETEVKHIARVYCNEHFSGEPLTSSVLEECFQAAFTLGTKYSLLSNISNSINIGELFVYQGDMLLDSGNKITKTFIIVEEPQTLAFDTMFQIITTHYMFDDTNHSILANREVYLINDGRTEIPAGSYDLSDFIIAKALHDKKE